MSEKLLEPYWKKMFFPTKTEFVAENINRKQNSYGFIGLLVRFSRGEK
jgi:hypothetical protein